MKVGIITFHKVNNYGAVLQAYALQKTIQNLGVECDIINYSRKNVRDILLWQKNKIISILKGKPDRQGYSNLEFVTMVLTTIFFNNKAVAGKFETFRKRYRLSRAVNSDTIKALNPEYDLFISGSDQVWNCGRVILDKNYLLGFVTDREKKGSYAASFGIKEIPGKYIKAYKELLSQVKYLSVREAAGADLTRELIHREAKVVLDPTLLLRKEEWAALTDSKPKKEEVIIVYMLEYSDSLLQFARELSRRVNCPLRLLNQPFHHKVKEECCTDVGPMEWLFEIQNAKYVVTNSFHGTAFSINFNRNFYVEIAEERIRGAMSSRIEHILTIFDLKDRLIQKENNGNPGKAVYRFKNSSGDIDYNKVNLKLNELRADSKVYLEDMLKIKDGLREVAVTAMDTRSIL
jgi:hypothetical protein